MKNILILGVAKSGKSYFAKKINKDRKYNYIPLDYFTSSFKYNIPESGITSNVIIDKNSSRKLAKFLSRVIEIIDSVDNEKYLIDSAHIYPEDIVKYIDRKKWDIYYLGYPNISVEDKLIELRKYVHDGWPAKKNDDELKEILKGLINISKEIKNQCIKYDLIFIDSSNLNI